MRRKQDRTGQALEAVRGAPLGPVPLWGLTPQEWKGQGGGWPLCDDHLSSELSQDGSPRVKASSLSSEASKCQLEGMLLGSQAGGS